MTEDLKVSSLDQVYADNCKLREVAVVEDQTDPENTVVNDNTYSFSSEEGWFRVDMSFDPKNPVKNEGAVQTKTLYLGN